MAQELIIDKISNVTEVKNDKVYISFEDYDSIMDMLSEVEIEPSGYPKLSEFLMVDDLPSVMIAMAWFLDNGIEPRTQEEMQEKKIISDFLHTHLVIE